MPIDFPNNPALNDTYSFADLTWRWDGQKWVSVTSSSSGDDGLGWTGGSYDAGTGIVTFTSSDGLGFSTGDLRGADGADGAPGATGPAGADGSDGVDGTDGTSPTAARFSNSATTGSFTTADTVLPFNTEDAAQSWATNTSGTVALDAGTYLLLADVTIDENAGNNRTEFGTHMEENSSGSFVEIPGTQRRHYSRNNAQGAQSASISAVVTFASAASVRVLSRRRSGSNTGEWIANGCSLTVVKLA